MQRACFDYGFRSVSGDYPAPFRCVCTNSLRQCRALDTDSQRVLVPCETGRATVCIVRLRVCVCAIRARAVFLSCAREAHMPAREAPARPLAQRQH